MLPYSILSSYLHISCSMVSTLLECLTIKSSPYPQYIAYTPISQRKLKPLNEKKFFRLDTKAYNLTNVYLLLSPSCFNGRGFSLLICMD